MLERAIVEHELTDRGMAHVLNVARMLGRALGGRVKIRSEFVRPGFRITESLRQRVLAEGQPLLSVAAPIAADSRQPAQAPGAQRILRRPRSATKSAWQPQWPSCDPAGVGGGSSRMSS